MRPKTTLRVFLVATQLLFFIGCVACQAPKIPNIQLVGSGYNRVLANPLATGGHTDPGYTNNPVFDFVYKGHTTPDGVWSIPEGFNAVSAVSCGSTYDFDEMTSEEKYYHNLQVAASVSGGIEGIGGFSDSLDYKRVKDEIYNKHTIEVHTAIACQLFQVNINPFSHPPIHQGFRDAIQQLVKDPNNTDLLRKIIGGFGTHVVIGASFGAEYVKADLFTQSSYNKLLSQHIDVKKSAHGSLEVFTGKYDINVVDDSTEVKNYSDLVSTTVITTVGSDLRDAKGDYDAWLRSASKNPFPRSIQLWSLSELLVPDYFPKLDPLGLAQARSSLNATIYNWCSLSGLNLPCTAPNGPPAPFYSNVVSNSGIGAVEFSCPAGTALSAGIVELEEVNDFPTFFVEDSGNAHCIVGSQSSLTCSALCSNAFSTVHKANAEIPKDQHDGGNVACPPGFKVASCGYVPQQNQLEIYPSAFPNPDGNSCHCYNNLGMICQATCVPDAELANYTIKSRYIGRTAADDKEGQSVQCDPGTRLLGCGFATSGSYRADVNWLAGPYTAESCRCRNGPGITCYAVCATF